MPSSGKTAHYGLNDWTGTDVPDMDDFNRDNEIIDAALHQGFGRVDEAITALNRVEYRGAVHTRQGLADTLEREQDVHDRRLEVLETAPKGDTEEQVEAHIRDRENPHRVTAEQLGGARLERLGAIGLEVVFEKLPDPEVLPTAKGRSLAFSPDGRYLAVGYDKAPFVTMYEYTDGQFVSIEEMAPQVTSYPNKMDFSPDGRYFVVCQLSPSAVTVFECIDGAFQKKSEQSAGGGSSDMAFRPDGRQLALSMGLVRYKFDSGVLTRLPDPDVPLGAFGESVAYSPDGQYLVAGHRGARNGLTMYKVNEEQLDMVSQIELDMTTVTSLSFSPDGQCLAVAGNGIPCVFRHENGSLTDSGIDFDRSSSCIGFSPNGRYLAVGDTNESRFRVYEDITIGSYEIQITDQPYSRVNALAFSDDGRYLALTSIEPNYLTLYKITPEARGIATLDEEGTIPLNQLSHKVVTVDNIAAVLRDLGFAIE